MKRLWRADTSYLNLISDILIFIITILMLWKFDMFKCICINLAFILLSFKCYSVNDYVEKLRQAGYKEKGRICIHSGNEMDYIRYSYALDGCKYAPTYFASRVPIEHTNEYVWNRVITSDEKCLKVLAVGFENVPSEWSDEAVNIKFDTHQCSQTLFLSGGLCTEKKVHCFSGNIGEHFMYKMNLEGRVSTSEYNHVYADLGFLDEDVPYMLNSHFFDYILIGQCTYLYINKVKTVSCLQSMLHENGKIIIPYNFWFDGNLKGKVLPEFLCELYHTTNDKQRMLETRFFCCQHYNIGVDFRKNFVMCDTLYSQLKNIHPIFYTYFGIKSHKPHAYIVAKKQS